MLLFSSAKRFPIYVISETNTCFDFYGPRKKEKLSYTCPHLQSLFYTLLEMVYNFYLIIRRIKIHKYR